MAASIIDSRIFQGIFTSDAMRQVWSDEFRTQKYLDIERALAVVQGRLGLIPHEAADEIVSHCQLEQIDLDLLALRPAHRGEEVVACQRRVHVRGAEPDRRQLLRINPDAHGLRPCALEPDPLHAGERAEPRLDAAHQIVRQLRRRHRLGCDADVERRVGAVGTLHLDHRRLGLGRQLGE